MKLQSASRIGTRLAAAVVRRVRRYGDRLLAPDASEQRVAYIRSHLPPAGVRDLVVVVTGSSRGVGHALAASFARMGARVAVNGRNEAAVRRAAAGIEREGGAALAVAADVTTVEGSERLVAETVKQWGRIDVLVNNAAILGPHGRDAWTVDPQEWRAVFETNVGAAFLCARAALSWMTANAVCGRIVNVSSGAGRMAARGMAPYVASKFALEGYTRALALDAALSGVTVCAVELGTVRTEMAKAITRWEDYTRLPLPETVVPVFVHAACGPAEQVHGRVLAAWRYDQDAAAEAALARPLASFPKATFAPLEHAGRLVRRTDPGIAAYDRAENPLGMSPRVAALLKEGAGRFDFSRYPDEQYPRLRCALAERLGLPPELFTFAAGSAELVERAVRTFAGCGDEVVSSEPTWFMFDRYCAMHEVVARKVPAVQRAPHAPFSLDLEAMARAVGPQTRLVYIVNPSNPLGSGVTRAEFEAFLAAIPRTVPVVVDEAYLEFSENPALLRTHEVVRSTGHMVIGLRTFSKFYGLAGLRVGYAFGTPQAMRLFERLEHFFAVSSLAEEAALAALEDEAHGQATHALLRAEKARIAHEAAKLGLATVPGEIHFMLVESPVAPEEAGRLWGAYADAGIIVPRGFIAGRYMMLPVLRPGQNDANLRVIASCVGKRADRRAERVAAS